MGSFVGNAMSACVDFIETLVGSKSTVSTQDDPPKLFDTNNNNTTGYSSENNPSTSGQGNVSVSDDIYSNPDIHLTLPDIIRRTHPLEIHEIETEDKYIITLHRIPHGRNGERNHKPPVLLVHGFLNSAGAWVMHPKGLGYLLADKGYDCWMLNSRGSTYSRKHQNLSDQETEYWDFSFHEMGHFDVPATLDYIKNTTGKSTLYYIGHSLGAVKLMIALNKDINIKDSIKLFITFAPGVYLYMTTSKLLSFNAPFYNFQKMILDYFSGSGELMGRTFVEQCKSLYPLVRNPEYMASKVVQASMYTMGGYNPDQIHWPYLPVIAGHTPSSTSVRTYIHCLQYFNNSEFRQYDYGSEQANLKKYGQSTPPQYSLDKVKVPTVIFYGQNDLLCRPQAVEKLASELPNVIGCYKVNCEKFSHTDFLYAKDVDVLLYNKVIEMIEGAT